MFKLLGARNMQLLPLYLEVAARIARQAMDGPPFLNCVVVHHNTHILDMADLKPFRIRCSFLTRDTKVRGGEE